MFALLLLEARVSRFTFVPSSRFAGALWITVIYGTVGTAWILFSDAIAARLVTDPIQLLSISMLKGWIFIVTTTVLLLLLILKHTGALALSEMRSQRQARFFRTLSECNYALIRADSEEEFFASVCHALAGLDDFHIVWIGRHDSHRNAIVPVTAVGPHTDAILHATFTLLPRVLPDGGPELSLPARAFLQGSLQVQDDLSGDEMDWPGGGEIHSACCLPLAREGHPAGVLAVGSLRPDPFDMELVGFLQELGTEVSFGLDTLERSASLRRAVADLEEAGNRANRLNTELESRVAERTLQLNEANQELEAFVFSVSHDLRAPLRAIDGFTRILQEEMDTSPPGPGTARAMAIILSETRRMGQLIDSMLALSRLGRSAVHIQPVDMHQLVIQAWEELQSADPGNHARMILESLPRASGDRNLLRQVWMNLLSNARKFSARQADPVITVAGHVSENQTIYTVTDNGVGFDMEHADHLFRVFQRLHSPTDFEGTGAGLAIVQRIIHRHGGTVTARSSPGQGAAFTFTLPVADDPAT